MLRHLCRQGMASIGTQYLGFQDSATVKARCTKGRTIPLRNESENSRGKGAEYRDRSGDGHGDGYGEGSRMEESSGIHLMIIQIE